MPSWLLDILVQLVLNFGLPYLLQKFPWLPKSLADVISELVDKFKEANGQKKVVIREAKREAFKKLRRHGVGSPPDTV